MIFKMPMDSYKILNINLYNNTDITIFELKINYDEIPKEHVEKNHFSPYIAFDKVALSISLQEYLDYENLDPYILYKCNLTKDFIKYTIEEATKEAEKIKEEIRKEDEAFEIKFCSQPLDEETFRIAKECNGDIFYAIKSHNEDCKKLGLKMYSMDDYEHLLKKYGFIKGA